MGACVRAARVRFFFATVGAVFALMAVFLQSTQPMLAEALMAVAILYAAGAIVVHRDVVRARKRDETP